MYSAMWVCHTLFNQSSLGRLDDFILAVTDNVNFVAQCLEDNVILNSLIQRLFQMSNEAELLKSQVHLIF